MPCNKKTYFDKKEVLSVKNFRLKSYRGNSFKDKSGQIREYFCKKCNGWHLSAQDLEEFQDLSTIYEKATKEETKRNIRHFEKCGGRKITVDDVLWKYRINLRFFIAFSENGDSIKIETYKVAGYNNAYDFEEDNRDGSRRTAVTPKMIRYFIQSRTKK